MDPTCIFCRIVANRIPAVKVLETEDLLAFLDIHPMEKGHVLVIPKAHYATLLEVPDELAARTLSGVRRIAKALMRTGAEGFNVLQSNFECAGQEVAHLHFHVIPRSRTSIPPRWVSGGAPYASPEEREQYGARIRDAAACTETPR